MSPVDNRDFAAHDAHILLLLAETPGCPGIRGDRCPRGGEGAAPIKRRHCKKEAALPFSVRRSCPWGSQGSSLYSGCSSGTRPSQLHVGFHRRDRRRTLGKSASSRCPSTKGRWREGPSGLTEPPQQVEDLSSHLTPCLCSRQPARGAGKLTPGSFGGFVLRSPRAALLLVRSCGGAAPSPGARVWVSSR